MTKTKRAFKDLVTYIGLYDGYTKPKLNFQDLYKLFPNFTFTADKDFGQYRNFGQAFEQKIYDMIVSDNDGNECFMNYREYQDANENTAYISFA